LGGIAARDDPDDSFRVVVWDGTITPAILDDWNATVVYSERVRRHVIDVSSSDVSALTRDDIRYIVGRPERLPPRPARSAIVVTTGWELARDYEAFVEPAGIEVIVFNHLDIATGWLGVDTRRAAAIAAELRTEIRSATPR
jgi:hypothetical protein